MFDVLIKCNVGPHERLLRLAAGAAAGIGAYFTRSQSARIALGTVASLGVGTAVTRYCPLNQMMGINRCQPAYRSLRQLMRRI